MDKSTVDYYDKNYQALIEKYDSSQNNFFEPFYKELKDTSNILDIGFGSGRDLSLLQRKGHHIYGIDACEKFVEKAQTRFPQYSANFVCGALPNLNNPFDLKFDTVICSAVLMHIHKDQLFQALIKIRNLLIPQGLFLVSLPTNRPDLNDVFRDHHNRLFTPVNFNTFDLILERLGFHKRSCIKTPDSLGRNEIEWVTTLYEYSGQMLRPLERIEAVLNQDRKTSTYKYALLRAMAEIAQNTCVSRYKYVNGKVAIPILEIANRWLEYYWPIFESENFIPQTRGEKKASGKGVAFRQELGTLINLYRNSGGISCYDQELKAKKLPQEAQIAHLAAIKKIEIAIRNGPVKHSGNSTYGLIFEYDSNSNSVLIEELLWKEFVLMNHWIIDALIIRWADFTSNLSKSNYIRPSAIVDQLLSRPTSDRDTYNARKLYSRISELRCTWSQQPLDKTFDVDHLIPFSVWRNNGLWNLLPACKRVNRSKSDKLPSNQLLLDSKDLIVFYWKNLCGEYKEQFHHEMRYISNNSVDEKNWENDLFGIVLETVETIASQRNLRRFNKTDI